MPMPTSLAPGYIRVTYDGTLFPHHMTLPVNFDGTPVPGTEPDIVLKDASVVGAVPGFNAFAVVLQPFFHTSTHIGLAEAHTVDPTTGDDQFIYAWDVGLLGTSGAARVAMSQLVVTFKLATGGLYKLYLMEGSQGIPLKLLPPFSAGLYADLSDFIVGPSSPVYGRSNAYPFVPVSALTKTNDKLRKQQGLA